MSNIKHFTLRKFISLVFYDTSMINRVNNTLNKDVLLDLPCLYFSEKCSVVHKKAYLLYLHTLSLNEMIT